MKFIYDTLITGPVDMGTSWSSDALYVGLIDTYTIQLTFIGTPVGTLILECSIDKGHPERGSIPAAAEGVDTWVPITKSDQDITEAGTHTWSATNTGYRWVRARWTPSSGDGEIVEAQISGRNF